MATLPDIPEPYLTMYRRKYIIEWDKYQRELDDEELAEIKRKQREWLEDRKNANR